jgi:hypothetical protein
VIDSGEPVALSVMVTAADNGPVTDGVKWPWIVQLAPAARLCPQLSANTNELASAPVTPMLAMERGSPPVLVNVTSCDALVVFTFLAPNDRLVDDNIIAGGLIPVPLSRIDIGDPMALTVMVTAAVRGPGAVGEKCPWIVQLEPADRTGAQELAKANEDAFAPVTTMLAMPRG